VASDRNKRLPNHLKGDIRNLEILLLHSTHISKHGGNGLSVVETKLHADDRDFLTWLSLNRGISYGGLRLR
jgi:hypothetical protein